MVTTNGDRILSSNVSLVLFGSFARQEFVEGSDYDWSLLIDGGVDKDHAVIERNISEEFKNGIHGLKAPGSSGTFGNMVFSHELVHRIGGGADSNSNLTRRMLMLLESRPISLSETDLSIFVWNGVLRNILERYFEEDIHFAPNAERKVPRFLLNDLTRFWRTMAVDYAAKHQEQGREKWALRNAKLRFSRKLLYASGVAFCMSCELNPPKKIENGLFGPIEDASVTPFIDSAMQFAKTPALEYLAAFIEEFVKDASKKKQIAAMIFGTYSEWLELLGNKDE